MHNSMIPEVIAGVLTCAGIIAFVVFNVISFNKHSKKDHINTGY